MSIREIRTVNTDRGSLPNLGLRVITWKFAKKTIRFDSMKGEGFLHLGEDAVVSYKRHDSLRII